jgi:hypothetical protein
MNKKVLVFCCNWAKVKMRYDKRKEKAKTKGSRAFYKQ